MILVCGEALIDLFVGEPDGGRMQAEAAAGGSPFNVSIALARLGLSTALLSAVSDDPFGDFLVSRLAEAGVSRAYLRRCPRKTTLSVVATDRDGHPAYTFYAEDGADRAYSVDALPMALPDEVNVIAAGSYALGVEPFGTAIEALIAREAGRRAISLDPNVRPRIVGDLRAFRARFERLLAHATVAKASVEDIELLYGHGNLPSVAWDWLRRGPRLVVFTRGREGSLAFAGGFHVERPAWPVEVVDTVGAGDAFHAGLLAALEMEGLLTGPSPRLHEAEIGRALDFAGATAALACTHRGAAPPSRAEVTRFMASGRTT
jgi:fructokinase